jgi:hypothetical protein
MSESRGIETDNAMRTSADLVEGQGANGRDSRSLPVASCGHGVERPEWMDLRTAGKYACVSTRKLRDWINTARDPLPSSQVERGKIRINRHEMDRWLRAHPHTPKVIDLNSMVEDVVREFRKAS